MACALPVLGLVASTVSGVIAWHAGSAARWRAAEPAVQRQLNRTVATFELPAGFAGSRCVDVEPGTTNRCWTSASTSSPTQDREVVLAALRRTGLTGAT